MKVVECISKSKKPTKAEAKEAITTLLRWIGEDPTREGLIETPERLLKSYETFFAGYSKDPCEVLGKMFSETGGFEDMIVLDKISFLSFCEHHMLPVDGEVSIAYIPKGKVVGISKLARVVDIFSQRLQLQERMTAQIANAINEHLHPKGVAVFVNASHRCMTIRGVKKRDSMMKTSYFIGEFLGNLDLQKKFLESIK